VSLSYRIHPAIGIARVGSSPLGWFFGPESPGVLANLADPLVSQPANGRYKDAPGSLKRQAARFRIYEYDDARGTPTPVREITAAEADIVWKVQLVNRKAAGPKIFAKGDRNPGVPRPRLIVDSGLQSIASGTPAPVALSGTFQGSHAAPVPVPLGELRVDTQGRLVALGGFGRSFSPAGAPLNPLETFNHDDWCDDTADGPVRAQLRLRGTGEVIAESQVDAGWLVVGPPDFAPAIDNVISLFDVAYDVAHARFGIHLDPDLDLGRVSFTRHIYPILRRAADVYWVEGDLYADGHRPASRGDFLEPGLFALLRDNDSTPASDSFRRRNQVFRRLRAPDGSAGDMPALASELDSGRQPALTTVQYDLMRRWAAGLFENDWPNALPPTQPPLVPLDQLPLAAQPAALDKAALDACVGASFYPGIEVWRVVRDRPALYRAPLRIADSVVPGTLTVGLALPWQSDFLACGSTWWPAQRPNVVVRRGVPATWDDGSGNNFDFTTRLWQQMGFVRPAAGADRFVEDERDLP
jgi:hypothetical protein